MVLWLNNKHLQSCYVIRKKSKHSIKFNRGHCYGGCRRCCLILSLLLVTLGQFFQTQTHGKKKPASIYAYTSNTYLQTLNLIKARCVQTHISSWLWKRRIQEKTNTSRMSLEASSKFSTSLACMSLLQREAALMATFHTWITRSHYSALGGVQSDL